MSGTSSPTAVATDDDALARAGLARALATAPIVSRGAALALGTAPRTASLLGTQLNASGGDFDIDPRVYLNPSLPWTAVVLGQQGSGRSHSAACLLESCIVPDARTGAQQKPMAALVCTYDELDVGQPSKLVSVALSDAGEKVTVLASPRRLKHMRKVYSAFKHVSVLPLSLRMSDISPALLLQLFEDQPSRLQRWVRSKCLKAAESLTYPALCKEANSELPKDLLESFVAATECFEDIIQEESPSVTLHFESGRLLVVDLSDPYTSAPTAAAITAVLTHTFACWNATRDKILVLENADAYLAAGPVLRRELAALTQRTAALNLRLLVSAHAPGPSFSQLMRDASFVVAHQHAESGPGATPLCPGEALLCSSGAVVLDNEGEPTLLGSKSLVVSVRTRMTGAPVNVPLLDASSLVEYSAPVIPPPPATFSHSNSTSSSSSSVSSRSIPEISMPQPTRLGPDADFFLSPTTASDATPTPPAAPLGAGSGASQKVRPNEPTRSTSNSQVPTAQSTTQRQPANNTQPPSSERNGRKAAPTARDLHVPVPAMQTQSPMIWTPQQPAPGSRRDRERQHKVTMEELEEEPEFRLAQALDSAAAHILEQVASRRTTPQHTHSKLPPVTNNSRQRNSISGPMYGAPPSIPEHPSVPSSRSSSTVSTNSAVSGTSPKRFGELINVLENFSAHGEPRPSRTEVASAIGESYLGTGFVTFRGYTLAAEKAGLVRRGGSAQAGTEWLELVH